MAISDPNRDALVRIAKALGPLRDEFVFVGGATVGLHINDPAAPPVRPTFDVDVIVAVATRSEYDQRVREALLDRGFRELQGEGIPICAWQKDGIRLDVMPTSETILGFSNPWYRPSIEHAEVIDLGDITIRIASPPYFVATKLAAFTARGGGDHLGSHDLEDIIAVIDGRLSIVDELVKVDEAVREFVAASFHELLRIDSFRESITGHLGSSGREKIVLSRLEQIAQLHQKMD
jgi:hypothetical protein